MSDRKKKPTNWKKVAMGMARLVTSFIEDYRAAVEAEDEPADVADDFIDQAEAILERDYPETPDDGL